MALCAGCEDAGAGRPERAPVLLAEVLAVTTDALSQAARTGRAVPDGRRASAAVCGGCGANALWHRTVRGRWIMMEPGDWPVAAVPAGKRWRIAGDGTAVNLGSSRPSDTCRISHFDVCPDRPAPVGSPVMLARWRRNAGGRAI
ncbi:DUF6083 domain-containing protein [Streptomyces sp. NPDC006879]|uniref:DUF6083 domain-containing protein n=1 Tax=Streptomyces sp. NPDC006879 TaxID=3364767 RepID=UPI0036A3B050